MPADIPEFPRPPHRITVDVGPKKRYAIDVSARELPDAPIGPKKRYSIAVSATELAEKPPAQVVEMPKQGEAPDER